ncbi:hypothetical protein HORIV_26560 [Vreelandella olivaria]|uniref:Mur ligase N-terminal catalytic domain-containing protein n=1 Tax=Vreelandella olivaria TaxID=390919 RepID=A0ABN5WV33_9GAMM|nr:hypothetical protein HORIV_26560 [Halomonas olivaria]
MRWALNQVAAALGIEAPLGSAQLTIRSVITDSRKIEPGCLFVALKGPHFDGHDFVERAMKLGAVAALVDAPLSVTYPNWCVLIHA